MSKKETVINDNGQTREIVVNATNVNYNGNATGDNAKAALDGLSLRVSTLESASGGGGGGGSYAPLAGKVIATIGDSFSAPGKWQTAMCTVLGATKGYNASYSGAMWKHRKESGTYKGAYALAVAMKNYYANSATQPDYILCLLGTNDVANMKRTDDQKVSLGDIDYGLITYDASGNFVSYARDTSYSGSGVQRNNRQHQIDPVNYIYDADLQMSNEASPDTASTTKLDTRFSTGGMQAALAYLKYHFPNAIIKIGYTPNGYIHTGGYEYLPVLVSRLQEIAYWYGVGYLDTLNCGVGLLADSDSIYVGNSTDGNGNITGYASTGHPSDAGQTRIGQYIARLLLSNL